MNNFIVSARKYRPSNFSDVVGQQHISQTLNNALKTGQIAHAFLFCGPRGVGKTTNARILAKMLNCLSPNSANEACGKCASCTAFEENASFSIFELDAASNNGVEHIRALIEQVRIPPQVGKYKVFIIDEVHMLSAAAFNAFLKTLEEPPAHAIFILATTEKHKILPTILSRCQIFDFRRISIADIVGQLKNIAQQEKIEVEEEALHIIAQKSDGGMRDALSMFDRIVAFSAGKKINYSTVIENLNVLDYDYFFQLTDAFLAEDLSKVLLLFDQILQKGFEADTFINGIAEHLRNILVCKDAATLKLLEVSENLRDRYQKQAVITPASFILTCLAIANECDVNYKMARNKRLHVELCLVKMCHIARSAQIGVTHFFEEKKNPDVKISGVQPPFFQKIVESETIDAPNSSERTQKMPVLDVPKVENAPQINDSTKPVPIAVAQKMSFNLDAFDSQVKADDAENESKQSRLSVENARSEWIKFAENNDSQALKNYLLTAEISVEGNKIVAQVGGELAKNMILQEPTLMEMLRKNLHEPLLDLEVQVDEVRAAANRPAPPPRKLMPKEIYEKMKETNPLIEELVKRFDLKPES
jgi:DNA polymerase III subunit gamma/tau